MTQIIYLQHMITINFKATPDPDIHQRLQDILKPYQALTDDHDVRIDIAEDLSYKVVAVIYPESSEQK